MNSDWGFVIGAITVNVHHDYCHNITFLKVPHFDHHLLCASCTITIKQTFYGDAVNCWDTTTATMVSWWRQNQKNNKHCFETKSPWLLHQRADTMIVWTLVGAFGTAQANPCCWSTPIRPVARLHPSSFGLMHLSCWSTLRKSAVLIMQHPHGRTGGWDASLCLCTSQQCGDNYCKDCSAYLCSANGDNGPQVGPWC